MYFIAMAIRTFLFIISLLYLVNFTNAFSLQHVMEQLSALEAKFEMLYRENKLRHSETKELFRMVSEISTGGKMITARDHVPRDASSDYGEHVSPVEPLDRATVLPHKDMNKTTESALELHKLEYYLIEGAKVEKDKNIKLRTELKGIGNMLKADYAILESKIKEEIKNLTNHLSENQKSLEIDYTSFKSNIREDMNDFKDDISENQKSLVSVEHFDNFKDFVTTTLSVASNVSSQAIISLKSDFETSISTISNNVSTVSTTVANINHWQTEIGMSMQEFSNGLSSINKTLTNTTDIQLNVQSSIPELVRRSCRHTPYSGIYDIHPGGKSVSLVRVYCDQTTDGGGWIVFQRRQDGSTDFERTWADYKTGFGNLTGEFWLGNDNLHALTSAGFNELRIDLEDFEGNKAYAKYSYFKVKSESEKYELEVRGYSGDAGDSLDWHNGMSFSTKDRDNDKRSGDSCSVVFRGAWWYNNCHASNLNGFYYGGANSPPGKGVTWYHWRGSNYSLKRVEMKIR